MTDSTPTASDLHQRLAALQVRLDRVSRGWAEGSYEALIGLLVELLPRALDSERATVFVAEPGAASIWAKHGTGIRERQIEAPREDSVVGRAVTTGRPVVENRPSPEGGFHREADSRTGFETRNLVCVPIASPAGHGVIGAVQVLNRRSGDFGDADVALLQRVAGELGAAVESVLVNREIRAVSAGLDREVRRLRTAYLGDVPLVAESPAMRAVIEMARTLAATPVNVLVQGENGTGKEVVARLLHDLSDRRERPFVAVNCASIPETLMESEFFGFERGAFTGAVASRGGRFEEATGGTLFLDEVADLPLSIQPKFLRAIQESEGTRLGSGQVRHYDFRVVSASNRDLRAAVARGAFREDLFYRLFAVEIRVPPLRERPEDVPPLTQAFLVDTARRFGRRAPDLTPGVLALFEAHPWPGNVRQLKREVERLVALTPAGAPLSPEQCSEELLQAPGALAATERQGLQLPRRVEALEADLIRRALAASGGQRTGAAALLGITRQGLHKKLRRLGIS
ncbi:MAG: sigma-54-dependent Fis family transcriptional regulator [Gammaproteobacteria bacterium]|jgi:transcriptional regulator with GAF, ATPase, and Fis domain|nr:sigma-54-dependent Fis family transcriptional regulator [Gammaproteobacteria bacterium]